MCPGILGIFNKSGGHKQQDSRKPTSRTREVVDQPTRHPARHREAAKNLFGQLPANQPANPLKWI
ncbi:hypothetical protein MGYG_05928 [Nannizzia gypsea CBS 118893]|uniref:Uncharacterized protein n=1 Tax=Arthroderma gypseum (strain ATCC MYA-4604 / CBS 118893) TaxID=535722 RepID=E4UZZ1_ARTGP|nr:hypothetical protein MGYG_05928 [Nannizzia gypsea CBS 118893]EFR02928.1 hypothetical protein MGYG_05928 [Nannizzia gypsea CBS 118893]